MRVLLVHGMGRTPLTLLGLARDLRRAGHRPALAGYVTGVEPWERIVARLARRVAALDADGAPFGLVGHSLGGILLAHAVTRVAPARCAALVTLGTPRRPPALALRWRPHPLFRVLFGEAGRRLAEPATYEVFARVPCRVVAVAGTRGFPADLLRAGRESDGIVARAEAAPDGGGAIEVPAMHTWLMDHPAARAAVREALAPHA